MKTNAGRIDPERHVGRYLEGCAARRAAWMSERIRERTKTRSSMSGLLRR